MRGIKVVLFPMAFVLLAGAHCGTRRDAQGIEQVWVPPGWFLMGTDDATLLELKAQEPPAWVKKALDSESPQHRVRLTKGFWIDKCEVTNAAFKAFADDGGYTNPASWSKAGLAWLAGQRLEALRHVVRGRGLRALASWRPADRGRVGVRRARVELVALSMG